MAAFYYRPHDHLTIYGVDIKLLKRYLLKVTAAEQQIS